MLFLFLVSMSRQLPGLHNHSTRYAKDESIETMQVKK